MKSILICGGGTMQLPAIRIARREGIRCIVADGNPACPGRSEADVFENIDLYNLDGMTDAARRHSVDGVFTAGTDFSTTVAWVAETLRLPGIPYGIALKARDKGLMRETLHAAGVAVPPFVIYEQGEPRSNPDLVPFPAVVKPVDNMGARGVKTVHSVNSREQAVSEAARASRSGRVICEAFIPGPEYSIDAISYRGTVSICGIGDRHIAFAPYFVETGHTIPTCLDREQQQVLSEAFRDAVRAIGIDPGAAKGDVFLVARENAPAWLAERSSEAWIPVVGEIAARLSGGYMSGWTYPIARGAEPTLAALRIALGEAPEGLNETRSGFSAERAIMSIPGIIRRFEAVPDRETVFLTRRPGDRAALPTSNVEKCGNLISFGDSYHSACKRADEYIRTLSVRLEPGNPQTEAFLFGAWNVSDTGRFPLTAWDADPHHTGERNTELEQAACKNLLRSAAHPAGRNDNNSAEADAPSADGPWAERDRAGSNQIDRNEAERDRAGRNTDGTNEAERGFSWEECLRMRLESQDSERFEAARDIRKASRSDCLRFLSENFHTQVPPRMHETLCDLAVLAIERGGLQGCEYLIDTVTRPEDISALCSRLGSQSHDA